MPGANDIILGRGATLDCSQSDFADIGKIILKSGYGDEGEITSLSAGNIVTWSGRAKINLQSWARIEMKSLNQKISGYYTDISIGADSEFIVHGEVSGIRNFELKRNAGNLTIEGNLDFWNGKGCLNIKSGSREVTVSGNICFAAGYKNKLSVGSMTNFSSGGISCAEKVELGKKAVARVADITGVNVLTLKAGTDDAIWLYRHYFDINYADSLSVVSSSVVGRRYYDYPFCHYLGRTSLTAGNLSGTAGNDKIVLEKYTQAAFDGVDLGQGNDLIKIGRESSFVGSEIDLGAGKNTISIDKKSVFSSGDIIGAQRISIGQNSQFTAESIFGISRFEVKSGDGVYYASAYIEPVYHIMSGGENTAVPIETLSETGRTTVSVKSIAGTDGKDKFAFGNNTSMTIAGDVELYGDDDILTIGRNSEFSAANLLLGAGRNQVVIGQGTTFEVGKLDGINKLTVKSEGDVFYIGSISAPRYWKEPVDPIVVFDETDNLVSEDISIQVYPYIRYNDLTPPEYTPNFAASAISGTNEDDILDFGKYTSNEIRGNIDLGNGHKDKILLRQGAQALITGIIDGVEQIQIADDCMFGIAHEVFEAVNFRQAVKLTGKGTGAIYDLGNAEQINVFRGFNQERGDNSVNNGYLYTISQGESGWLSTAASENEGFCGYEDLADCFAVTDLAANELERLTIADANENLLVKVYQRASGWWGSWEECTENVPVFADGKWHFSNLGEDEYGMVNSYKISVALNEEKFQGGVLTYQISVAEA